VVAACQRRGVRYSITAKLKGRAQGDCRHPRRRLDTDSLLAGDGADVAETSYRPFGRKGR
jgi:hypothetical protein